jgi:excinuclease ABC subunit A
LVDAIEMAYREAGTVIFEQPPAEGGNALRLRFSQAFECKNCDLKYEEPEPRLFSFNNPFGACPRCQGFGNTIDFDLNLVVPDPQKTLNEGPIDPWNKPKYKQYGCSSAAIVDTRFAPIATAHVCGLRPVTFASRARISATSAA